MTGIFKVGDPLSLEEISAVLERTIPDLKKRPTKAAKIKAAINFLSNTIPQRLEHEVNRYRRWAFDAGEEGFSYTVISEGT